MDGAIAPLATAPAGQSAPPAWHGRVIDLLGQAEWTTGELLDLDLPGWPGALDKFRARLDREGVLFREVAGNGGVTRLYNLYSMPRALRNAIGVALMRVALPELNRYGPQAAIQLSAEDLVLLEGLPATQAERATARAFAVRAWERFERVVGLVGARGAEHFARMWADGAFQNPDWVQARLPSFSGKSLLAWRKQLRQRGLAALAGDYKPKVATLDKSEALRERAIGLFASFPHAAVTTFHEELVAHAAQTGEQAPSLRAVQRWMKGWREKNALVVHHALNPDAARSRFMPAFGDAGARADGLNALWEMDTTPFDILLEDGRRWTIVGIIDVWSRDLVFRLAPTTSGHSARTALRHALMELGVPGVLRTDNGSDLRNAETERLMQALLIEMPPMPVGRPDLKPFIERAFRTLQHDLVPLLPGYAGHDVAEAQALRSRKSFMDRLFGRGGAVELRLSPAQAQEFLDGWVAGYRKRRHSSLGMSPSERRASWPGSVDRIEDERALDVLLAPLATDGGLRIVAKKGIRADGGHFVAPELGDMVGETVLCRHDPVDAGRLYVFDEAGRFVCVAEDWRLVGADPQALAEAAKKAWRETIKSGATELRGAAGKIDKATLAMEMANRRAAAATNVTPMPRPTKARSTDALEQGARAARAGEAARAPERTEADMRRQHSIEIIASEMVAEHAESVSDLAQKDLRIAKGRLVAEMLATGEPFVEPSETVVALRGAMTVKDLRWFHEYRNTAEWRWACKLAGLDPATGTAPNNPA